jgi:sugar porter (SP) family MFS transporter
MGILTLVEDRPTPKNVYNWRVYFSAAVAASAAMMIGYDSAFIGGTLALKSFKEEFHFDDLSKSQVNLTSANIVSCYQAGAFFGAFFAYPAGHFLGRKRGLQIFATIFTLGAGLMLGANGSRGLGLIYGGRVLAGVGVGGASNLSPIYCSEIAPPAIRGRLVGLYEMAWQIGGLVGFWINYGVSETMAPSHEQWIIPFAIQLIPAGLLFAGAFIIRESPRWLFSRGRRDEGTKNLCWLRKLPVDHLYMQEEIFAIDNAIEYQRSTVGLGFWQPFRAVINDRKTTYRFLLGGSLFLWQNATGINAINYYSPTVFKSIGVTGTNTSLLTTGIFGVIKTLITIVWLFFLIDKLGRRALLMYGAVAGSLCMWYIGGYIAVAKPADHPTANLSSGGISAMAFFYLWTACYTPSWNGTPWVLNSEMFSQNVRTLAQAFAAANNWFWNFIIARFTPQMFAAMGFGVYMFFASLMLCAAVFVFFLVPETKGIPLEAMDRLFSREIPARRAHKTVLSELRLEEQEFRRASIGGEKEDVEERAVTVEKV